MAEKENKSNSAAAAPSQGKPKMRQVEVVATKLGYYGMRRIREGQRFTLTIEEGKPLPKWVVADKKAVASAPSAATTPLMETRSGYSVSSGR